MGHDWIRLYLVVVVAIMDVDDRCDVCDIRGEWLRPPDNERQLVHDVIYGELVKGVIKDHSRSSFLKVIDGLIREGATGIILGCTEIELLVQPEDTVFPLFQTTRIHAEKAVELALKENR